MFELRCLFTVLCGVGLSVRPRRARRKRAAGRGERETEKNATWQASWFARLAAEAGLVKKTYWAVGCVPDNLVRTLKPPGASETRDRIRSAAAGRVF